MWMLLLATAWATDPPENIVPIEPLEPEVRTAYASAFGSAGIIAGGFGFTLGVSGDTRAKSAVLLGELSVGGRSRGLFGGFPQEPGIVLGTLGAAVDFADGSGLRIGFVGLVDTAVVDEAERDCASPNGCRHYLWLGAEGLPVGASFAPAAGIRMEQPFRDGTRVTVIVALQDHRIYGVLLPGPRGDAIIQTNSRWEVGAWLRRHGIGLRMGRVLGPPR